MKRSLITIVILPTLLTFVTGCAAKYQTIRKGQGGENQNSMNEPVPAGDDATPTQLAPSAQVEVVVDSKVVMKVKAGSDFVIRPSTSTMDPDNRNQTNCPNPGIIKATYKPGPDGEKIASRAASDCSRLEVTHNFPKAGRYEISMIVISDEFETASSKMTLEVVPADAPDNDTDGGFIVTAEPLIAEIGQNIIFTGDCTAAKSIVWDFKDTANSAAGNGAQVAKAYSKAGQYQVTAECLNENEEVLKGEISVVVVPKKQTATPGNNDDSGTTTDDGDDGSEDGHNDSAPPTNPGTGNGGNGDDDGGGSNNPPPGNQTPPDADKPTKPSGPGNPGQNPGQTPYQGNI